MNELRQIQKTPTEADYLYPTGFDVSFHASCYVTVRVGAFSEAEALEKVKTMLITRDSRNDKASERILGVPSFEDSPTVDIEIQHISKVNRKSMWSRRIDLPDDVIREWLVDPSDFPELDGA